MQSLQSLPLSAGQRARLKTAGFETPHDFKVSAEELASKLNAPINEATQILDAVHPAVGSSAGLCGQSALDLLRAEELLTPIITFSSKVDVMLGGGVALGKITEICGAPGTGKTQFSMQLAVDTCIPEAFGVWEEKPFLLVSPDTEGSFVIERLVDMAEAAVRHINNIADMDENGDVAKAFTVDAVLRSVHYYRCHDYVELVALTHLLPQVLTEKPKVRLIAIDSIAAPFRQGFHDMGMRNRILGGVTQNLIRLASVRDAAVVLTNQMTIKSSTRDSGAVRLTPALGESWGHACTVRMVVFWQQSQRYAMLYKSPNRKEAIVSFQVTEEGVRDVFEDTNHPCCDADILKDFATLSSSQLAEIERLDVSSCEEEEPAEGMDETRYDELYQHVQLESADGNEATEAAAHNGESGSSRKRPRHHSDF